MAYLVSHHDAYWLAKELLRGEYVDLTIEEWKNFALHVQLLEDAELRGYGEVAEDLVQYLDMPVKPHTQRSLSRKYEEFQRKDLLRSLLERTNEEGDTDEYGNWNAARSHSLPQSHSSDWLSAVPTDHFGQYLQQRSFRLAAMWRLGLPMFDRDEKGRLPFCRGCNKVRHDEYGHHALKCNGSGNHHHRSHEILMDCLNDLCKGLNHRQSRVGII